MDFSFGPKMMRSSTMYMFKGLFRIEQSIEGLKDSKKARLRCSRCIVPRNSVKMQVQITFIIQFFKAVSPLLSISFLCYRTRRQICSALFCAIYTSFSHHAKLNISTLISVRRNFHSRPVKHYRVLYFVTIL